MKFIIQKWAIKMTIYEILDEVIDEKFVIKKEDVLKIVETDARAKGKEVILKTSKKIFCFSLEQKESGIFRVYQFFKKTTEKINSKNDAIIICEKDKKYYLLIIELKSDNINDYLKQIKKGKIFAEFLRETINLHYNEKIEFEYRGIVFHTGRKTTKKRPTSKKECPYENRNGIKIVEAENNSEYYLEYFLV